MDELCFRGLLGYVESDITHKDTNMRKCIPPAERLLAALRFLATGENFKQLGENSQLSRSFLQKNIIDICDVIYLNLRDKFLKFPTQTSEWVHIAEQFEAKWQFPNCLGALDGKHVAMTPNSKEANLYYKYEGFHSVVLLAMCDAQTKFTFIDVGRNGRISDGGFFRRSALSAIVADGERHFPAPRIVGRNRPLPYVIVADNAFPMSRHLMTPFSRRNTEPEIITFNARLSRARQCIERAFGILSNGFKILQRTILLDANKNCIKLLRST